MKQFRNGAENTKRGMKRANWNHVVACAAMFTIFGMARIQAQTKAWTSIGPQGGDILAVSIDPHHPRTLYAATAYGGAFKSLDGGVTWGNFGGPNRRLLFDPMDPNTIYSIDSTNPLAGGEISKSTDGGKSWIPSNSGFPAYVRVIALAIDPLNPLTLYAGTTVGVFKSTDAGRNWSDSSNGLPVGGPDTQGRYSYANAFYTLIVDPQNPSTLYAAASGYAIASGTGVTVLGRGGLFKSLNGGAKWQPAGFESDLASDLRLAIDPKNTSTLYVGANSGIFKTLDGGASWRAVTSALPPFEPGPPPFSNAPSYFHADSVIIDPKQPETIYAIISNSFGSTVVKTRNGGESWSETSSGLPNGSFVRSLDIDRQHPKTLYAGTAVGLFKTTDGGRTWSPSDAGLSATSVSDLAIDPRNSASLYATTSSGLVKTVDGGMNWTPANSGLTRAGSPLVVDPRNMGTVFAAGCIAVSGCGLVKSTDGGTTWRASWIAQGSVTNWITALSIDPQNSNVLYMTTQDFDECGTETLHKSADGGSNWSHLLFKDLGVTASCVLSMAIDPQNPGNLYAAFQRGGVFKSTDAGSTWNAANSGLASGTPLSNSSAVALAIDPASPSTIYTLSVSGIFKSTDGAMSWNPASSGLPDWSSGFVDCCFGPRLAIDPTNSAKLYLGIAVGGAQHVFQTSDAGASWVDSGLVVPGGSLWFGGLTISAEQPATVYAGSPSQGVFKLSNTVALTGH